MKREEDQELWDLLGKGSTPEVSPFFARNIVRAVRQESRWRERIFVWLRPRRLIPVSAVALAMIMAAFSLHQRAGTAGDASADNPPELLASIDPQDYDTVADLDDLLDSEDDNLWNDETSSL